MKHVEKVEFKNAFEEYIFNSSLAGFNHLNFKATFERFIWFIIHLFSFGCTCFLISYTWQSFMTNPTVTTVETTEPHLTEVPMPGISVCSINKISKWRAVMYANELSEKSKINMASIMQNISLLGYLYEYNLPNNPESLIYFQIFLEKWDYTPDGYFNTSDRLKQLQSSCEEVVQNCKWRGRSRPCTDIFATQLTMDGYCCVFNYVSDPTTTNVPPIVAQNGYKPISFAPKDGLQFTVLSNASDTFFTTIATEAPSKILLSLPTDFPDTTSGGLIEKIIDRSTETFLRVRSVNKMATLEIKKYSVDKRGCKFSDEIKTIFGDYSYSDCIMDCKIRSILALCQCVPYNFIRVFKNPNDYIQCNLGHLSCLNSYANKWRTLYPVDYEESQLEREKQDSILCKECVPSCSDTRYEVSTESADISIKGGKANFSIVHITYENSLGMFNKQDAFFYWYDMISIFGGICSVTMGLSFISIVEILYFLICVTLKNRVKNYVKNRKNNNGVIE